MFRSIYADELRQYFGLRSSVLSDSARMHEQCYLKRFDRYVTEHIQVTGQLTEANISNWVGTLQGKSGSIENEIIVVRQFLGYLSLSGEPVFMPAVPKVRDDYTPYIFSDEELVQIFGSADNVTISDKKADPYLPIEFPVILRLLYSCGLRIGETVRIDISDVDLENGVLRLINTKGDKHRLVPISQGMNDILKRYCLAMGLTGKSEGWLFPSGRQYGHISDKSIKRKFETILRKHGICLPNRKKRERGPCLHCLRHVFAFKSFAQAERAGRFLDDAIPYLSIYLGHDSLNETSKYLKFSSEMFPEAVETFGAFMDGLLPEVNYET